MVLALGGGAMQQSRIPRQRREYRSAVGKIDDQRVIGYSHRSGSDFTLLSRQRIHAETLITPIVTNLITLVAAQFAPAHGLAGDQRARFRPDAGRPCGFKYRRLA
jgi:hypothetical protein